MPRNMTFMLTTEQVRNRTKTVTRRIGWWFLKPGDILNACVKCQGLGKGGKIKKICKIRVKSVERQKLSVMCERGSWGNDEASHEGFPGMTGKEFVAMFCEHMGCDMHTEVNRIEFEYLECHREIGTMSENCPKCGASTERVACPFIRTGENHANCEHCFGKGFVQHAIEGATCIRNQLANTNEKNERLRGLVAESLDCLRSCPNIISAGGVSLMELRCKLNTALTPARTGEGE